MLYPHLYRLLYLPLKEEFLAGQSIFKKHFSKNPQNRVYIKVYLVINSCILTRDVDFRQRLNSVHTTASPKQDSGGWFEKPDGKSLSKIPKGPRTLRNLLVVDHDEKQESASEPCHKWHDWEMVGLLQHCSPERKHNSGEQPLRSVCSAALQTCLSGGVCLFFITINFQQDRKPSEW